MGKIQVLSEHMTNLIAAGEVIERACSVVKELVENSIDAGATKITVSLIDSGINEIRVIDNGSGMDQIDAKMALVPHATSKIVNQNDLFTIGTLGFRGEALASIVAVSNFKLITSQDGHSGIMLSLKGGIPLSEALIAHAKGTEIVVKNLFFNTPARLQNLQSQNVELSFISDYVSKMAIAHPNISFTLSNNEKELLHTYGNNNLLEVISSVYSNDIAKEMLTLFNNDGLFKIEGYTSKISVTRSSKNAITLIINGRIVHNTSLINSVVSGYGNMLMNGRYPIAVINVTMDPGMVDVNVHPAKYEVRIADEQRLKTLITSTISSLLSTVDMTVSISKKFDDEDEIDLEETMETFDEDNNEEELDISEEEYLDNIIEEYENGEDEVVDILEDESEDEIESDYDLDDVIDSEPYQLQEESTVLSEQIDEEEEYNLFTQESYTPQQYTFNDDEVATEEEVKDNKKVAKMYYIGQLFGTYILAQNEDNFYLIDQHAANERINYEKIKNNLSKSSYATYELLVPFTLSFSQSEAMMIHEKAEVINKLGIIFDDFGNNSFVIRQIPIWIFRGKEREFVEEIITKVIYEKGSAQIDFLDSLAKSLACKKSIKANEYHSSIEIEYLLEELAKTSNPFTCPHGRPVIVSVSKSEIEKWFKRIV